MYTIAQVLDPGGQPIDRVLPPPLVKRVGPQLTGGFMAGAHMEDTDHDGVRNGGDRPSFSPTWCQAPIERGHRRALGPDGAMGQLGSASPYDLIPLACLPGALFPCTLIIARGHPRPRCETCRRAKTCHIHADLCHDHFRAPLMHPRDRLQQRNRTGER